MACTAGAGFSAPARTALSANYTADSESLQEVIKGIIEWKKNDVGAMPAQSIFTPKFLGLAGSASGDWYPLGIGRYGYKDNYAAYLAAVTDYVSREYQTASKLGANATEWHRIALAVSAAGGDPTEIGDFNNSPINLIADGVYNRNNLGGQGINGWAWGLIVLDSKQYEIPDGAANTRESIITAILAREIKGGGFALTGTNPDPSITGMVVQALSPYYENRQDVRLTVDRAITWLSSAQESDGGYVSWGTREAGSGVWAMLACISIGIDPLTDSRFIKNGNSLLDGIMRYRNTDGGFLHSYSNDPENPLAVAGKSNSMASEQVLYGLVGLYRFQNGMNNLFDMSDQSVIGHNVITAEDISRADTVINKTLITTEDRTEIDELLYIFSLSGDFEGKAEYIAALETLKTRVTEIQVEIDSIMADIIENLYPFDKLGLKDKKNINAILARYEALSEYDRTQFKTADIEAIYKSKAQLDNLTLALWLGVSGGVIAVTGAGFVAINIIRRKKKKAALKYMPETDE